jgi:hypothetical protein
MDLASTDIETQPASILRPGRRVSAPVCSGVGTPTSMVSWHFAGLATEAVCRWPDSLESLEPQQAEQRAASRWKGRRVVLPKQVLLRIPRDTSGRQPTPAPGQPPLDRSPRISTACIRELQVRSCGKGELVVNIAVLTSDARRRRVVEVPYLLSLLRLPCFLPLTY